MSNMRSVRKGVNHEMSLLGVLNGFVSQWDDQMVFGMTWPGKEIHHIWVCLKMLGIFPNEIAI